MFFHCSSPTDSIILTLGTIPNGNRLVKPGSLVATEVNRILRGLRHQEKCCFQFLHWLMHAVLSVTLLLCVSDCRLENSAIKAYWSISKKLCGRGKIPPLLSDSNPVSVFLGEINLKILFANWPTSSSCQLLRLWHQTEKRIKSQCGFHLSQQLSYTFQLSILPRVFPALNKTI